MGQPSPPELSPAMSGALLFGAVAKGALTSTRPTVPSWRAPCAPVPIVGTISRRLTTAIGRPVRRSGGRLRGVLRLRNAEHGHRGAPPNPQTPIVGVAHGTR